MISYQDESDAATYFIEVPFINLEKFDSLCKELSIKLELQYFGKDEIISNINGLISSNLSNLFNIQLTAFIDKHIEERADYVVKGRYAVLSIVTTPTNYRTLGLLASYFKKHGEQWRHYRYPVEEPTEQEIVQFDGEFFSF